MAQGRDREMYMHSNGAMYLVGGFRVGLLRAGVMDDRE